MSLCFYPKTGSETSSSAFGCISSKPPLPTNSIVLSLSYGSKLSACSTFKMIAPVLTGSYSIISFDNPLQSRVAENAD
jgi:hypothetical protein